MEWTLAADCDDAPRYTRMRAIFLRGLGGVYAIAFASLAVQIPGLIGADGILPAGDFLDRAFARLGSAAYYELPTLLWLGVGDGALLGLAWGGVALSLLLAAGIAPLACLLGCWGLYLSLCVGGQDFLYFQWDTLLLETGLTAVLIAPSGWALRDAPRVSGIGRWALWALLFKLMFLSGITKLVSGDPTWAGWLDGRALALHFETQPLPVGTSWYAHGLPAGVLATMTGWMWLAELVAPFGIFVAARWRRVRWACCGVMVSFQLGIIATGSYGFFNLLTILLCLSLLDDEVWRWGRPAEASELADNAARSHRVAGAVRVAAVAILAPLSALAFVREIALTAPRGAGTGPLLAWSEPLVGWARPFRSINGYGLFRVLTAERREIVIEGRYSRGADDPLGAPGAWQPYAYRWQVGAREDVPGFATPHMPRLDWQLWFAGLDPQRQERWLVALARHLLEGTPEVRALLGPGPFETTPPDELRLRLERLEFAAPGSRAWWVREPLTTLTDPLSLSRLGR